MSTKKNWLKVDCAGFGKTMTRRKKGFAVLELVQNAWDEPGVGKVDVTVEPANIAGYTRLRVVDDAPDGFKDLTHAYTLFAESQKKNNLEQRGRFNFGEKLVLAIAREAKVVSTTGGIHFKPDGTRHILRKCLERGSEVEVILPMNKEERELTLEEARRLLPPKNIVTTINGDRLEAGEPVFVFEATLPTEVADAEGKLKSATRKTIVRVYEATAMAPPFIYEGGIPICPIDGRYRFDVKNKIPVTLDRENVDEPFKRLLSVAAFNAMHHKMTVDDMNNAWAKAAVEHHDAKPEAVADFVKAKFGDKVVSFDPSDPEANKLAAADGYTVVPGGTFSSKAWENIRATGLVKPAGQMTPSKRVWDGAGDPNAGVCSPIAESEWTDGMLEVAEYSKAVAREVLGVEIRVAFFSSPHMTASAAYGPVQQQLDFNKLRLSNSWFSLKENRVKVDDLLIHEFGHHYASDHLSEEYYDALTGIAARFIDAVRKGRL